MLGSPKASASASTRLHTAARLIKLLLLGALAWSLGSTSVAAYDDQAGISVSAGYGHIEVDSAYGADGASLSLGGNYGLGDTFTLRGGVGYALHPAAGDREGLHLGLVQAEILYTLDLLQFVPFFGIGADLMISAPMASEGVFTDAGGHLVVGGDYWLNREWIVGLDLRAIYLPVSFDGANANPVYVSASLRLSRQFELF